MANFIVHINDRTTYFVEGAKNKAEAELIAWEWFIERTPKMEVIPVADNYEDTRIMPRENDVFDDLCDILEKRATDSNRSKEIRSAYNSALTMVLYALRNDRNALAQFNY